MFSKLISILAIISFSMGFTDPHVSKTSSYTSSNPILKTPDSRLQKPNEIPHPDTPQANNPNQWILSEKKDLDSSVKDIIWLGNDYQTVFILTDGGGLYKSTNEGRNWETQNPKMWASTDSKAGVLSMYSSKADENVIFFIGQGHYNWITRNKGISYQSIAGLNFHEAVLHPTKASYILAASMSPACDQRISVEPKFTNKHDTSNHEQHCYKQLYSSIDMGTTWKMILEYVVQFSWGPTTVNIPDTMIYACTHRKTHHQDQPFGLWDSNVDFIRSKDFFKSTEMLIERGNRFIFTDHSFLLVAQVKSHKVSTVNLMINNDNVTTTHFERARLPQQLVEHSYTLLDTSEGSIFLHVNHHSAQNAEYGDIYMSDASGLGYTLTLPRNRRNVNGKCDFEKVEGLEGIYLANFVDEGNDNVMDDILDEEWDENELTEEMNDDAFEKEMRYNKAQYSTVLQSPKTVITFDKGAYWQYLDPPKVNSEGQPYDCDSSTDSKCKLHLHSLTDPYGPFYSSYNAIGLIMGTGVVGNSLHDSPDVVSTFLSRDAGLTWFEVSPKSHIYEFGDHGALIVMAEDEEGTDSILYSWNQGISWSRKKISDQPFHVENIVIEPSAVSETFIVHGYTQQGGVIIWVNFEELHERPCVGHEAADNRESDYETFSPNNGKYTQDCLMGHKVSYTRRKRNRECYNPEYFESYVTYEHCICMAEDYECDEGYEREHGVDGGECILIPNWEKEVYTHSWAPFYCERVYKATKGYRRIAGDTCIGGQEWEPRMLPCPSVWLPRTHSGKGILLFFFLVLVALCFFQLNNRYGFIKNIFSAVKGHFPSVQYHSLLGKDGKDHIDTIDEDEFSVDEEFGDAPELVIPGHPMAKDKNKHPKSSL